MPDSYCRQYCIEIQCDSRTSYVDCSRMATTRPQFLDDLRRRVIVRRVQSDSRTHGNLPLGVTREQALEAIGWGQADFDEAIGVLSPEDLVLLYAYWNQPGHIDELSVAFAQLYEKGRPTEPLIVIDLGCGPFTGGLALASQLDPDEEFDYIGVDRSRTMRQFGEEIASSAASMPEMPHVRHQWTHDIASIKWATRPGWRPVLVVVSFLLASPSLNVKALVSELDRLLLKLGRGVVTVLYTNSPKAGPNRSYPVFRDALVNAGFHERIDDVGAVETSRRTRRLRYALFRRPAQRTLNLGDNSCATTDLG